MCWILSFFFFYFFFFFLVSAQTPQIIPTPHLLLNPSLSNNALNQNIADREGAFCKNPPWTAASLAPRRSSRSAPLCNFRNCLWLTLGSLKLVLKVSFFFFFFFFPGSLPRSKSVFCPRTFSSAAWTKEAPGGCPRHNGENGKLALGIVWDLLSWEAQWPPRHCVQVRKQEDPQGKCSASLVLGYESLFFFLF